MVVVAVVVYAMGVGGFGCYGNGEKDGVDRDVDGGAGDGDEDGAGDSDGDIWVVVTV